MMRLRRRGCVIPGLILGLGLLVAGLFLYRFVSSQVDLRGAMGEGGVADVRVPAGFQINIFAEGLNGPRFMAVGPDGVLYVADRGNNRIVALPDADGDGMADEIRVFAEGINSPHSLVYQDGRWYVGVPSGVVALEDADGDGVAEVQSTLISNYPTSGHSTRTVLFLPDGRMVVSVGSSCNVCVEEDERRGGIVVYDPLPPAGEQIYVTGLRNAVGLAIRPETGELWATNNGRDLMGDDVPPETVYRVEEGANYGWPFCHSGDIIDPDFGSEGSCEGIPEPVVEMQAHTAPLGLTFYDGEMFPAEYQGDLFIALHGSWNRSTPVGYEVVRLSFEDGQPAAAVEPFATGWLPEEGAASGRPVGVTVGADGALYISDDKGGFIYRVSYPGGPQ